MADGHVRVKQNSDGDRLVDNEVLTVGGETVYRQRVVASSPLAIKIAEGSFFLSSSSRSVTSGSEATWSVANPSGSGKVIYLVHVSAANDNTAQIRFDVYQNSTITGGDTRTPWNPNFSSANTSIVEVVDGTGIRSGGTQLEAKIAVVRDHPFEFEGLLVLPPGTSLQLTGVVPGALSAQQLTVGGRWYEEAI